MKKSHPTRVRGLKFNDGIIRPYEYTSHPTRVRGLKYELHESMRNQALVAPYTGAWIEIKVLVAGTRDNGSHPTRVRGLK